MQCPVAVYRLDDRVIREVHYFPDTATLADFLSTL